jgi:hypothetical protein
MMLNISFVHFLNVGQSGIYIKPEVARVFMNFKIACGLSVVQNLLRMWSDVSNGGTPGSQRHDRGG